MTTFPCLHFPQGDIAFVGLVRVSEEGVREFRVDLPGRAPLYGTWKPVFVGKDPEFSAEVVSFGYSDMFGIGKTSPKARAVLSANEIESTKLLIGHLFSNVSARSGVSPFGVSRMRFTEQVEFADGWAI